MEQFLNLLAEDVVKLRIEIEKLKEEIEKLKDEADPRPEAKVIRMS